MEELVPSRFSAPAANTMPLASAGRRRISPEAGRALEILGHAIEYLSDEYAHHGDSFSAKDGKVEAVQLLMAINRQIYLDCPLAPSFSVRLRSFLRRG